MLIPKCCVNCTNKNKGVCCCTLPSMCNEYVEDTELNDIPVKYNTEQFLHSEFSSIEEQIRKNEREKVYKEIEDYLKKVKGENENV